MTSAALVRQSFIDAAALHAAFPDAGGSDLVSVAEALSRAFASGHQVLVFGNGGSATDAQHFAAELVGRFQRDRRALPVVALTADGAVTTSVANDLGFEAVFARQVEALGRPGDIAFGITTSGTSPNVNAALRAARAKGLTTVALTGRDGGVTAGLVDLHINVPGQHTARIQEVHRTVVHVLCELVEAAL